MTKEKENETGNASDSSSDANLEPTVNENASADIQPGGTPDGGENQDAKYKAAIAMANAEKTKRQTAEDESQNLRDQIALQNAAQQQSVQQTQPKDIYDQLGIESYESPTVEQQRQIDAHRQQESQAQAVRLANQQFENSHSDFGSVVGLRNPVTGQIQPTAEILEILQKKQYLTAAAYASSQGAYNVVMDERKLGKFEADQAALEEHQKRADIDTETQPLGGSAAGSGSAGDVQQKMMTREQVLEVEAKLAQGEAV